MKIERLSPGREPGSAFLAFLVARHQALLAELEHIEGILIRAGKLKKYSIRPQKEK